MARRDRAGQTMIMLARAIVGVSLVIAFVGPAQAAGKGPENLVTARGSDASERAFAEISGCVSTGKTLLASIVVDESASLKTTDPDAFRVSAIETAIDALEDLRSSAPRALSVQVSLGTFARRFTTLADWRELNRTNADELRKLVAEELPKRNTGDATDYRVALTGARKQLDSRARTTGPDSSCKLLLWFTDGALDVDAQTASAAKQLCREQGIADGVREDGISILALALFTRGGLATPRQRDQLRAVAEGTSNTGTCGSTPIPESAASGAYLAATDAAALGRLFAGAGAIIAGGAPGGTVVCPGTDCRGSKFAINVDPGVGGFRAIAQMSGRAPKASLVTPSSTIEITGRSGTRSVDTPEGTVQITTRSGLITISVASKKVATRVQEWTLDLDGRPGIVDLYWVWGAKLTAPEPSVIAGQESIVRGTITNADGTALPLKVYSGVEAAVQVGDQAAKAPVAKDGTFEARVSPSGDTAVTTVPVSLTVRAVTRRSQTALGPLTSLRQVKTMLPPSFPTISPDKIDLGTVIGTERATATLKVIGTPESDARVCFTGSSIKAVGGTAIRSDARGDSCVSVKAEQTRTLHVGLTPSAAVDGHANGNLKLSLESRTNGQKLDLAVPVQFDLVRPVNEAKRWALVALLLAGALVVPLLILMLSDWLLTRFIITPTHQLASVPIYLTPQGLKRRDGRSPLVTPKDLRNLPQTGTSRVRRYDVPSSPGVFRAQGLRNVLRGSRAVIVAPGNSLVVNGTRPLGQDDCRTATARFGVVNAWFVITDGGSDPDQPVDGILIAVVSGLSSQDLRNLIEDAPWDSLHELVVNAGPSDGPTSTAATGGAYVSSPSPHGDELGWMEEEAPSSSSAAASPSWLDEAESDATAHEPGRGHQSGRPDRENHQKPTTPKPPPPDIDFLD